MIKVEEQKQIEEHTHALRYIFDGNYPDPLFDEFKQKCKAIQQEVGWRSFYYVGSLKAWVFSKNVFGIINEKFPEIGFENFGITEQEEPIEERSENLNLDTSSLDMSMIKGTAYPHQLEAIAFLKENNWRGILAMDMGTGKTLSAIASARMIGEPAIVICPASVKYVWEQEVNKWTDCSVTVLTSKDTVPQQPVDFLVLNYELLRKLSPILKNRFAYKTVIVDEMHKMKSPKTKQSKAVIDLQQAKNRILLSGTPMVNKAEELFMPLHYVDPVSFKNYYAFGYQYCNAKRVSRPWASNGSVIEFGNPSQGFVNMLPQYMFRKRKEEVLKDLPPKIIQNVVVHLNKPQRSKYNKALENYMKFLLNEYGDELDALQIQRRFRMEQVTKLMELKKMLATFKMADTIDLAKVVIEDGNKVLIFTQFLSVVEDIMNSFGEVAVKIDGSCNETQRKESIESFQNDPNVKVFVATTQAGGIGITLTEGNTVIFNDMGWTPAEHDQAIDRAHRIGSEKHSVVNVYYVTAFGTFDQDILELLDRKRELISQIIDGRSADTAGETVAGELIARLVKHSAEGLT